MGDLMAKIFGYLSFFILIFSYPNTTFAGNSSDANRLINDFRKLKGYCKQDMSYADSICVLEKNRTLSEFADSSRGLASLIATAVGMAKVCDDLGKYLRGAQTAVGAYQISCSGAKLNCDNACADALAFATSARNQIYEKCQNHIKATEGTVTDLTIKVVDKSGKVSTYTLESTKFNDCPSGGASGLNTGHDDFKYAKELDNETNKNKENSHGETAFAYAQKCSSYSDQMALAAANLINVWMTSKAAKDCKQNTEQVAEIDCTKQENLQMAICICKRNPRSPGCAQAGLSNTAADVALGGSQFGGFGNEEAVDSSTPSSDLPSAPEINQATNSGSGVNTPGAGNAPGLGGSNLNPSGSGGGSAGGGNSRYNVISMGEEGGGGGGGARGGAYQNRDREKLMNNPYAKYLPGGEKDPSRNPSGLQIMPAGQGEVTTRAGKSNWEKIRERYQNEKYKMNP